MFQERSGDIGKFIDNGKYMRVECQGLGGRGQSGRDQSYILCSGRKTNLWARSYTGSYLDKNKTMKNQVLDC